MKFSGSVPFITLFSYLLSPSDATGTFQVGIKREAPAPSDQSLKRRSAKPLLLDLHNDVYSYWANITIGTPPQEFSVQLDTGSHALWVPADYADVCTNVTLVGGCTKGSFNSTVSSTANLTGFEGTIIYGLPGGKASGVEIEIFWDTLSIGGIKLHNFEMGLAVNFTGGQAPAGILGIGLTDPLSPSSLVEAMVDSSIISSRAYSLWLNDVGSSEGSILFGGIDTSKYSGDLIMLDWNTTWTSVSVTSSSGTDNLTTSEFPMQAAFDTGNANIQVPYDILALIFEELGATPTGYIPCSFAEHDATVDFGFGGKGGPIIKIPIAELINTKIVADLHFKNGPYKGQEACEVLIIGGNAGEMNFGDPFLRNAYIVYDLANQKMALAQTVFNSTAEPHIVPFASSGAPIPSAKTLTAEVTTFARETGTKYKAVPTATASLKAAAGITDSSSNAATATIDAAAIATSSTTPTKTASATAGSFTQAQSKAGSSSGWAALIGLIAGW